MKTRLFIQNTKKNILFNKIKRFFLNKKNTKNHNIKALTIKSTVKKEPPKPQVQTANKTTNEKKLCIIYIKARDAAGINFSELIEIISLKKMKYGEDSIFHKYEEKNNIESKAVAYSIANISKPGTFSLKNIPETKIKGVAMFTDLNNKNNKKNFMQILNIAYNISSKLNGVMLNHKKSNWSAKDTAFYLQEISWIHQNNKA